METEISSYGEPLLKDVMRLRRMSMVTTDIVLNAFRIPAEYIEKEKKEKKKENPLDTYKVGQFVYLIWTAHRKRKFLARIEEEYKDKFLCRLLEDAVLTNNTFKKGSLCPRDNDGWGSDLMEPWIPELDEKVWIPEYKRQGLSFAICRDDVGFEYKTKMSLRQHKNVMVDRQCTTLALSLSDIEPYYGQDLLEEMSLLKEKEESGFIIPKAIVGEEVFVPFNNEMSLEDVMIERGINPEDHKEEIAEEREARKKEQEKRDKTLKEKRKEKNGSIEPQQKSIFSDYPQWSGHAVGEFDMEKFQKSGRIL